MNKEIFHTDFRTYCNERNWSFDNYTSEFTFQFRICRFLEYLYSNKIDIELESNINRYNISNLIKKEIDIDILKENQKIAIELKFVRDRGSYNIGMFNFCEDIKFIEELITSHIFHKGYAIIFTTISELFTPNENLKPRNKENEVLYQKFRNERKLYADVRIKTGNMDRSLNLKGSYNLEWFDFTETIKVCIVEVNP